MQYRIDTKEIAYEQTRANLDKAARTHQQNGAKLRFLAGPNCQTTLSLALKMPKEARLDTNMPLRDVQKNTVSK